MGDSCVAKGEDELNKLRRQYPRSCLCFCKCDVTDSNDVKNLFDQALELHGCIDILINNAGIFSENNWERMIDINVTGMVRCFNHGMKIMCKDKGGKGGVIINTASILGLQQIAGAPVYVGSKHFVIGFTRCYGMPYHYLKSGVRVMAICPGVTLTPLITNASKVKGELAELASKELNNMPKQDACFCGQGFVTMLKQGDNGSIWLSEDEELYEIVIPDRHTFRV